MDVSVVLISHNQAWNITRLIDSVLRDAKHIPLREVVLVDSASVDNTVALAARYPMRILRLPSSQRLTAAAGRYVGYKHTTSPLVLFLDGDMELQEGWLRLAIDCMARNFRVAAVTGHVLDCLPNADSDPVPVELPDSLDAFVSIPFCGGAGMYRRTVLDEVGQFNPYLYADEEPDLCLRIRAAGYSVVRLDHLVVKHYSDPSESFSAVIRRWRHKYYLGAGQNLRYKMHTTLLWPYIRERGYAFVPGLAIVAGVAALLKWILYHQPRWFELWLTAVLAVLALDAARKRSIYRPCVSIVKRLLVIAGTILGFLEQPRPPESYPGTAEVIYGSFLT